MQAHEIDDLNTPVYAVHEEIQKLNANVERLIGIIQNMQGRLVAIEINTKPHSGIMRG